MGSNQGQVPPLFGTLTVSDIDTVFEADTSNLSLSLSAGGKLGYALFGDLESTHYVLYIPGVGVGRKLGMALHSDAKELGLKVVSIDRPGVGESTDHDVVPRPKEASTRMAELLKHLGIDKFHLMAHSAGCLYALGASIYLKESVLEPLVLFAPWVTPDHDGANVLHKFAADYIPSSVLSLGAKLNNSFLSSMVSSAPSTVTSSMSSGMSEVESAAMETEAGKHGLKLLLGTIGKGNTSGTEKDVLMCLNRIGGVGFDFAELTKKATIYAGTSDSMVPVSAVESFANVRNDLFSLEMVQGGTHNIPMDSTVVKKALLKLKDGIPAQ